MGRAYRTAGRDESTHIVFLVAEDVNMAICLSALAAAAAMRNKDGHRNVTISSAVPAANRNDARNRHFLASPSNFRPCLLAHTIRDTFPRASFNTQVVAAASPA